MFGLKHKYFLIHGEVIRIGFLLTKWNLLFKITNKLYFCVKALQLKSEHLRILCN